MATKLNKLLTGHTITDELFTRTDSTALGLEHDTIRTTADTEIWTGAGKTGTKLTITTDYTITDTDTALSTEAGVTVYTKVAIVNGTYQNIDLYANYKTVGDYNDADDVNNVSMVGLIQMYAGSTAPNTYWKICDGSAVSRKTYSALFAAISTTYGTGDGSTTFNLPDFQGRSPKGVGTSTGGTDVTHVAETVTLALKQNDRFQGHYHTSNDLPALSGAAGTASYTVGAGATTEFARAPVTDGTNGTPRTGAITTGKCLGINFIIKVL